MGRNRSGDEGGKSFRLSHKKIVPQPEQGIVLSLALAGVLLYLVSGGAFITIAYSGSSSVQTILLQKLSSSKLTIE